MATGTGKTPRSWGDFGLEVSLLAIHCKRRKYIRPEYLYRSFYAPFHAPMPRLLLPPSCFNFMPASYCLSNSLWTFVMDALFV